MLTEDQVLQEANRLDDAEIRRQQIVATTTLYPGMDIDDAYRIQDAWVKKKMRRGFAVTGHKIGLTSRTMQRAMHIDEPDFGVLFDSMYFRNGASISCDDFLDPRVEVELAFILSRKLNMARLSIEEVLDATDRILPAIELIAARTFRKDPNSGYTRTVFDTISDNAANAGYILGDGAITKDSEQLRWVSALLYNNDVLEETGVAAGVLDHPANGIVWLARKYSSLGRELLPGQVILSGSFTRPVPVVKGSHIRADFGTFGTISCEFV